MLRNTEAYTFYHSSPFKLYEVICNNLHFFWTFYDNIDQITMGAFHLPELAGQIGLFVNGMHHFEGLFRQILHNCTFWEW